MTGYAHHNAPAFDAAANALRRLGCVPISPPDITRANPQPGIHGDGSIDELTYRTLVRLDLRALLCCAAVVLLPGWSRSNGCKTEIVVAKAIGIPIYSLSGFLNSSSRDELKLAAVTSLLGPAVNDDKDDARAFPSPYIQSNDAQPARVVGSAT